MPRIDPVQLLKCLSVLLSPNGGIKSTDEVQRLASLMTKFSKKLVSKCIYIQILKCTETELLGLFMGSGGWRLVHTWLTESIVAKNWPLVRELLELLLLCPVDIERLKTNNCPKLVKELSKDGNHFVIRALASKLVEQWLKTVKGDVVIPVQLVEIPGIIADAQVEFNSVINIKSESHSDPESCDHNVAKTESKQVIEATIKSEVKENYDADVKVKEEPKETETLAVYKISGKDIKQEVSEADESKSPDDLSDKEKSRENKHKSKSKDKSDKDKDRSSSKSSSSKHSSKSISSSSDRDKSHKSTNSSSRHSSSSSSSKEKDKSKEKDRRSSSHSSSKSKSDRKSSSSSNSSSSKSKDDKHKLSSDKDKSKDKSKEEHKSEKSDDKNVKSDDKNFKSDDKEKCTPSIQKLGKIPKLSDVKKDKPSISIEVRKPDEPKPKTVKTFHSKFRKHGLEEEVKPPPSRAALLNKKVPPVLPPTIPVPKRPSPVRTESPPEKKPKIVEPVEKPGSIKLISPKPKPQNKMRSLSVDAPSLDLPEVTPRAVGDNWCTRTYPNDDHRKGEPKGENSRNIENYKSFEPSLTYNLRYKMRSC